MGGEVIDADGTVNFDTPEFQKAVDLFLLCLRDFCINHCSQLIISCQNLFFCQGFLSFRKILLR